MSEGLVPMSGGGAFWCGHCQDHYDTDHYTARGAHRSGIQYGQTGAGMAARRLLQQIVRDYRAGRQDRWPELMERAAKITGEKLERDGAMSMSEQPWTLEDSIAEIRRVSEQWPDGVHTREELEVLEPGRRTWADDDRDDAPPARRP